MGRDRDIEVAAPASNGETASQDPMQKQTPSTNKLEMHPAFYVG